MAMSVEGIERIAPDGGRSVDEEHLRVLALLFWVYGGLAALAAMGGLLLLGMGSLLGFGGAAAAGATAGWRGAAGPEVWGPQIAAGFGGLVLTVIGGALFVLGGMVATLRLLTGFALSRHRYHTFCLVSAVLTACNVPLGSLLGIFTLVVLLRPSVERLFAAGR
jgi:hypothetical protein